LTKVDHVSQKSEFDPTMNVKYLVNRCSLNLEIYINPSKLLELKSQWHAWVSHGKIKDKREVR